jgi:L-aminopeptidase/D-esterase-like protein
MDKFQAPCDSNDMSKARPGPRNLITDVAGLTVGQAQDETVRTGVTVILPDERAVCAVDVRGGGPGTRETDALNPENLVGGRVDAVVLSGGSMYGLGAGDGVAAWLGARGRGYPVSSLPGVPVAPIVPAAILFDMGNGGDKAWGLEPPYRRLGIEAAQAASLDFALGVAGAGYGAKAGQLKGGTGSASIVTHDGYTVGAIAGVNSFGSVVGGDGLTFWASLFEIDGEFGGRSPAGLAIGPDDWGLAKMNPGIRENTTIACVATDAILTPVQARRVAIMAQAGLAQAIRPVHTPFDGDVVFALSTGRVPLGETPDRQVARIGALAADCLARAIARGVHEAVAWPGCDAPDWRSLAGT